MIHLVCGYWVLVIAYTAFRNLANTEQSWPQGRVKKQNQKCFNFYSQLSQNQIYLAQFSMHIFVFKGLCVCFVKITPKVHTHFTYHSHFQINRLAGVMT